MSCRFWSTRCAAWLLAALVGLVSLLTAPEGARADLLFLKDGFAIQGKVRRESITEFDPVSRESITIPKGFFLIDDGPRRIFFSPAQVRIVEKMPAPTEEKVEVGRVVRLLNPKVMPAVLEVTDASDWDSRWERTVGLKTLTGRTRVPQILAEMTPYYFRADATKGYVWHAAYLTRELPPETLERLLATNPAFDEPEGLKPEEVAARRLKKIDFHVQAGLLTRAGQLLDQLAADLPAQKERAAASRKALARLEAQDRLDAVKRAIHAGRYARVRELLENFPEKDLPSGPNVENVLTEVRELKAGVAAADLAVKDAARFLDEGAKAAPTRLLAEAARAILEELHPDNAERLESFLGQARQAERQRVAGRKPAKGPAELLALAVTGWLLGSPSAEANPDAATRLWRTRDLALAYQREPDAEARKALLAAWEQAVTPRVEVDEVCQLLPHLPPADAAKDDVKKDDFPSARKVGEVTYHVQLPLEYHPGRSYPALVVLHAAGEKALTMLERWREAARAAGVILVAPQWQQGLAGAYGYTPAEHQTVTEVLRDVRRRYAVDGDRVFLFGLGEGGNMAFDVGFTYPDLFAGVVTMGAAPFYFPGRCWRNAQYLPLYVVGGTQSGESALQLRRIFDQQLTRGYPGIWVSYKGRGQEWFGGEVPNVLEWMRRQARPFPLHQLGTDGGGSSFGNEFTLLRPEGRFFWLGADRLAAGHTADPRRWNNLVTPAQMTATYDLQAAELNIRATGVTQFSVWVGRNAKGQYSLDLDRPLTVRVGFRVAVNGRKIIPSHAVLLEDVYRRGDRQQAYVARLEVR